MARKLINCKETKVVNLYKENYEVYIGRAGKNKDGYFGNPFPLKKGDKRGSTLEKYKEYFYNKLENDSEFKKRILSLRGKVLGCFCKPNSCHGDIIVEYLNNTMRPQYYEGKITELGTMDIFVFGSNTEGRHGKGAAKLAKDKFGAIYGQNFGRQGKSFAIVTKDLTKKEHPSIKKSKIVAQILYFYLYAIQNDSYTYYVAYSGKDKNLNGYSNEDMAKMFAINGLLIPDNIVFEKHFLKLIENETTN